MAGALFSEVGNDWVGNEDGATLVDQFFQEVDVDVVGRETPLTVDLPDKSNVLADDTVFDEVAGENVAGTFEDVSPDDVVTGTLWGADGTENIGVFDVPLESEVQEGVTYGANGTEFTGTFAGGGGGVTPSTPTLAITDNNDGSITAAVAGDDSVTNRLYYKLANSTAWIAGGSRVDDGAITKSGLTIGARYDFVAVSDNSGSYSLPSSEVTLTLSDGTAQSYIITLAELVKDEINANIEFDGSPVTAVRDYMTFVKLQDLDELLILVTPQSEDMGPQARRKDGQEYLIDVGVFQKVDSKAEADALLKLLDDIYIHFQRYTASGYSCMAAVENPIYSPEAMQLEKRFVSKITLTFKSFK